MGDCLLLTSPIRALKEEFPDFRVSVLVESRFAGCFEGNPDVDEVLSIARKKEALKLARRRFELVLNLHGGPTSLAYSLLPYGPQIGFEQFQYRRFYNGLLPSPDPKVHSVEATMAAFQWLGVQRQTPPPLRFEGQPGTADADAICVAPSLRRNPSGSADGDKAVGRSKIFRTRAGVAGSWPFDGSDVRAWRRIRRR